MTYGGIAHGIGAALLREFAYDPNDQLMTQSFLDYLMPSSHNAIQIVKHCSFATYGFWSKDQSESGYLGSPAAISSAINDAVSALDIRFEKLPIRIAQLVMQLPTSQHSFVPHQLGNNGNMIIDSHAHFVLHVFLTLSAI